MARIDTLANFVTDIATAIKAKTGKTDPITPANFDTEIASISGGSAEDLTEELSAYDSELTSQQTSIQNVLKALENKAAPSGGETSGGQFNIFCQNDEPETKEGIWIPRDDLKPVKVDVTNSLLTDVRVSSVTTSTNVPQGLREAGVCSVGDSVYIIGGSTSGASLSTIYKYDTVNDSYVHVSTMHYKAYGIAVATDGTDIYTFGGRVSSYGRDFTFKYDTLTGTITQLATMPYKSGQFQAVRVGRDIYMFGGMHNSVHAKACKYNIDTNTFTLLPDLPSARNCVAVCAYKDTIYIAGGYTGGNLSELVAFDTITNEYKQLSPMPISTFGMGIEAYDGYLILVGGTINDSCYQTVYRYNIEADTYKLISNEGGHGRMDCALVGDKIYVPGGIYTGSTYSNVTHVIELNSPDLEYSETKDTLIVASSKSGKPTKIATVGDMNMHCSITGAAYFSVAANKTVKIKDIYYGTGSKWEVV